MSIAQVKRVIKSMEMNALSQHLPKDIKRYLLDTYGDDPWPYEQSEQGLVENMHRDISSYFEGKLDVHIKTPLEKAESEKKYFIEMWSETMTDLSDMRNYVEKLHDILRKNNLDGPRFIGRGIDHGTYRDFDEDIFLDY